MIIAYFDDMNCMMNAQNIFKFYISSHDINCTICKYLSYEKYIGNKFPNFKSHLSSGCVKFSENWHMFIDSKYSVKNL